MVIKVEEIVPHVNELLKYGETKAPTEQHARLIMNWHILKGQKMSVKKLEDGCLITILK